MNMIFSVYFEKTLDSRKQKQIGLKRKPRQRLWKDNSGFKPLNVKHGAVHYITSVIFSSFLM